MPLIAAVLVVGAVLLIAAELRWTPKLSEGRELSGVCLGPRGERTQINAIKHYSGLWALSVYSVNFHYIPRVYLV